MAMNVSTTYEFGPFRFDSREQILLRDGTPVHLTKRSAALLLAFLQRPGEVISSNELRQAVWTDTHVGETNLGFQLSELRRSLGEDGNGRAYFENVRGRGYRFVVPVREVAASPMVNEAIEREGTVALHQTTSEPAFSARTDPDYPLGSDIEHGRTTRSRRYARFILLATAAAFVAASVGIAVLRELAVSQLRVVGYRQLTADLRLKSAPEALLTDGDRVYFALGHSYKDAASVSVDGGQIETLEALRDFLLLDVSRTKSAFLAVKRSDPEPRRLWIVPTGDGAPHPVGAIVCLSAAWSPDGQWIAYTMEREVHIARTDGTDSRKLATVFGSPRWLRWSPDGSRLRFTVATAVHRNSKALWEVRSDGTGLKPVLADRVGANDCCGSWTPDGQVFVFEEQLEWKPERAALSVLAEPNRLLGNARQQPLRLTDGPLSFSRHVMSPDGKRLFAIGMHDRGELVRYESSVQDFVPYLGGIPAVWVNFSRDQQWVTYALQTEETLWRARADGSEAVQLTRPPMTIDGCSFSPDAKWIAFRGRMPPAIHMKIYLVPAAGGEPKSLIAEDREQGIPAWSPDGTRLTFGEVPITYGLAGGQRIHIYDIARREFSVLPGSEGMWTSRWSPDGRYILAQTIADRALRLFDTNKRTWRSLDANHVDNPTWARDGRYVYYHTEGVQVALRRIRVSDGRVEELVDLEYYPRAATWWSGLALDGSPIILRNFVQVYALDLERRR
jgi:DNA-binding winged helix-turn-helix (wHTH) protein/Tol biopolymer transport system component